jgi:hypothetical protein
MKAWAIKDKHGKLMLLTVRDTHDKAWSYDKECAAGLIARDKKYGYTCVPVEVTEASEQPLKRNE